MSKLRRLFQLLDEHAEINGCLLFRRRFYIAQIRVGIECGFKLLRIYFSILVQNMRVNLCYHIRLRVPRIPLRRLDIAVIELQLISRA